MNRAMIEGKPVWGPRVPWEKKKPQAYFRGIIGKKKCTYKIEPSPRSHCFRKFILEKLANNSNFDAARLPDDTVANETEIENYQFVLILGNTGGWAERTMHTLFKSCLMIYVDQKAYEWYMPLLIEGKHYLK